MRLERFLKRVLSEIGEVHSPDVHVGWDYAEHEGQTVCGVMAYVDKNLSPGDISIEVIIDNALPGVITRRIFSPSSLELMEESILDDSSPIAQRTGPV